MIVRIRLEVGDDQRRAIRAEVGKPGIATRKEVAAWVRKVFDSTIEAVSADTTARAE